MRDIDSKHSRITWNDHDRLVHAIGDAAFIATRGRLAHFLPGEAVPTRNAVSGALIEVALGVE
jgi:hypothetical protein